MLEFKWGRDSSGRRGRDTYEPVELGPEYKVVYNDERAKRNTVSDGRIAFDVIHRGALYNKLVADWQEEQKRLALAKPKVEHLRETILSADPVAVSVAPVIQIDEQTETEEFVDAVTAEETPFTVDPADWFDCILKSVLSGGRDVVGELENGALVIVNERDVTTKDQAHSLCLKGRQCWVRLELNAKAHRHHYAYRAIECQVQVIGGKERTQASGVVLNWAGSMGAARLDCGFCSIGVGTRSPDDVLDLKPGDKIEFEIYYNERLKRHLGNITAVKAQGEEL
jgi:hypothetical protein